MPVNVTKVHSFTGHSGSIYALAEGTHEHFVLSGGSDRFLAQWNLASLLPDTFSAKFPSLIYSILPLYTENILFVGTTTGSLHVIDLLKKEEIKILQFHTSGIFDLKVSEKHNLLFSCGADGKLNVYDLNGLHHIQTLQISSLKLRNMAVHENRNELSIADGLGYIHILTLPDLSLKSTIDFNNHSCNCLIYHPNDKYMISGGRDAHLRVWDIENDYTMVKAIPAHNFAIYDIKFLEGVNMFATASRDKTIKLWAGDDLDFILRINKEQYDGHVNSVNKLYWERSKQLLVSASDDRSLMVWWITTSV
jgi:WD40 repeat protein